MQTKYQEELINIINKTLDAHDDTIASNNRTKQELDINLYLLLIELNGKEYKGEIDKKEALIIDDFLRLLNNYKVQIELKRTPEHLEEQVEKIKELYYNNTAILNNYLSSSITLENILTTGSKNDIDELIINITRKKNNKQKYIANIDNKRQKILELIKEGENIYVKEDYVIIGSITLTIEEFKEIFSYLLNIDNFESKYNDPKLKNAQLCIYMDIISNINNKTISSKRISKILIQLLLQELSKLEIYTDENTDSSHFIIENIKLNDLSKEEIPNDKSSKIIINNKNIYISNEYLINKILSLFKEGKYYFMEDMFVIDGDKNDFKGKIPISQMISYLTHLLVTTIKSEKKHNYSK